MSKAPISVDESEIDRFLSAWFNVRQIIQAANFNHFHKAGLSATQFMTLNLIPVDAAGISMGELARRMNLKPATVAQTVASLEGRRMLSRTKSPSDGRLVLIKTTKLGRELQNSAAGQFRDYIRSLFLEMPHQRRAGLIAGLESLVRSANTANELSTDPVTRRVDDAPPARHSSQRVRKPKSEFSNGS